MVQQLALVWLSLFAIDTEHPTNSFVPDLIFSHAGGDSFTVQQLTLYLRYDSDLLIMIHLNYFLSKSHKSLAIYIFCFVIKV